MIELPERLRVVLLALLAEYIETARPVSSDAVLRRSGLCVSPATIRARMARLAEMGLLSQPHTSAGRIPTEEAFRLYVDDLIRNPESLDPVPQRVRRELSEPLPGPDAVLRKAAELVAKETGQLGFFVSLAHLHVARVSTLLAHPEFADVGRLRQVLGALEEGERMQHLLDRVADTEMLRVVMGHELEDSGIPDCAVVTAPLGEPPSGGGLGVIGPLRMRYDRVIPVVRYVSEHIGHCIV